MPQLSPEEIAEYLKTAKIMVDSSPDWPTAKRRLAEAGRAVGYKPIVRCLIMDMEPEKSTKLI